MGVDRPVRRSRSGTSRVRWGRSAATSTTGTVSGTITTDTGPGGAAIFTIGGVAITGVTLPPGAGTVAYSGSGIPLAVQACSCVVAGYITHIDNVTVVAATTHDFTMSIT